MVEDAKKEQRSLDKAAERRKREQAVIARNRGESEADSQEKALAQEKQREEAQEALVQQIEDETAKRMPRAEGKRRTKCVIHEVTSETKLASTQRTKCIITEVSEDPQGSVTTEQASGKQRRAKSRKDREERLRQAMAAVETERKDSTDEKSASPPNVTATVQAAPVPQFTQLSDSEIEQKLIQNEDTIELEDEESEILVMGGDRSTKPVIEVCNDETVPRWGIKTNEMAKADTIEPSVDVAVSAEDMLAVLDVDELD